ncbi:MAG TPA: 2-dehydropantoate 2-reductase N-terminal domain-containing protein [Myxococcota bacterium]|nr:2-dehydropantoate 2-reductase N-terminal domain-containing protein [Myxococcota bacterium]
MRALLVGAGAVGQVFGRHLQASGDHLTFFVRDKYRAEVEAGLWMHPEGGEPVRLVPDGVITRAEDIGGVDELWLCVSSTALAQGDWLEEVLGACPDARVVFLQPGLEDRARLLSMISPERLVTGMISYMAWQAPLPGQRVDPPGIRYWFPWLSPTPFSGPGAEDVVRRLRAGGCPSKVSRAVHQDMALGSATLLPIVANLELVDWKFGRLTERSAQAAACVREARGVAADYHGISAGMAPPGFALGLAAKLAVAAAPVPIEAFFQWHFTKVGDQTRASLGTWIRQAEQRGRPVTALRSVADALAARARH